jgi:hypothetical protein
VVGGWSKGHTNAVTGATDMPSLQKLQSPSEARAAIPPSTSPGAVLGLPRRVLRASLSHEHKGPAGALRAPWVRAFWSTTLSDAPSAAPFVLPPVGVGNQPVERVTGSCGSHTDAEQQYGTSLGGLLGSSSQSTRAGLSRPCHGANLYRVLTLRLKDTQVPKLSE